MPSESQRGNFQSPAQRVLLLSPVRCTLSTGIHNYVAVHPIIELPNGVTVLSDKIDPRFLKQPCVLMVYASLSSVLYAIPLLSPANHPYVSRYRPTTHFRKFSMQLLSFFSERYPYNSTGSLCTSPLGPWSLLAVASCWSAVVAHNYGDQAAKFRRTLAATAGTTTSCSR